MVIDKIFKMTVKCVKLKSESFFLISHGVLELWRKNLRGPGRISPPQHGGGKCKYLVIRGDIVLMTQHF